MAFRRLYLFAIALLALRVFGAASEIRTKDGEFQTARASTTLPVNPSVIVRDNAGNPVAGVQVTFQVETGGGIITGPVQMTGADGIAAVGSWTLGPPGNQTISATAPGLTNSPLILTATAAGPPVTLEIFAGNDQVGTVSRFVRSPCVIVKDALGTGVPGSPVTFGVVAGGGTAGGISQLTNSQGIGIVDSWQLGSTPGVNQLEATCGEITGSRVVFDAFADPDLPGISGPLVRPLAPVAGETVTLTAASDLQNASYTWDFGDGTQISGAGATVMHAYAAPGSYLVSVQATNLVHSVNATVLIVTYNATSLSVERKSLKAQNPSVSKDTLSLSGKITLPSTLTNVPTFAVLRFGSLTRSFDNSPGAVRLSGQSFRLSAKVKNGTVQPEAKFSLKASGDLASVLKSAGLAAGQSGSVDIPVQIVLPQAGCAGNALLTFTIAGTAKTQIGR